MSGPKDYTPPPKYSLQVFDGKLNKVFQLQSRLKLLCSEIEGLHVSDSTLNIQFDCKIELGKIRSQIDKVQKALVFDYKGTFGQATYNRINGEIDLRISELQKTVNACELIKNDFAAKSNDYNSFLSYLIFYNNSNISFNEYKNQILYYLKTNIESSSPEIFKEADKNICSVGFTKNKSDFYFGFNSKFDSEKQTVIEHLIEKENLVNNIRAEISDKVIDKFATRGSKVQLIKEQDGKFSDESKAISEKIISLIRNCDDRTMRRKFRADLEHLANSEILKDTYFFKELHDSIFEALKIQKIKVEINRILSELSLLIFHTATQTEKQNLVKLCLNLIKCSSISINEFEEIKMKLEHLRSQSNKYFEEDEIKNKETLFLKSQIILCLENQGYEVMDDLEVIDFEKENDFLLKIKGQENFLNLKFREDGSLRYAFQIPENKEDLNTDEKNMKLHEMKITCADFKAVLKDLSKMGLKVNMRSEKPIELDSIVSVTKKEKIKTINRTQQQKQQLRKKYLN